MTTKTGLRYVFESVRQLFVTSRSTLEEDISGTISPAWSCVAAGLGTGAPVRVEFVVGGTVGTPTPGITYRTSVDDGASWTDELQLKTASTCSISFPGGVLSFSLGSGTVGAGDELRWIPQPVAFEFGELASLKQSNQGYGTGSRIVFSPGDESGRVGPIVAPIKPGGNPRPLADMLEKFRVFVWGYAGTDAESALAQHEEALLLFNEALFPAMWAIVNGIGADNAPSGATLNLLEEPKWMPVTTRQKGREIVSLWSVRTPMPELPYVLATGVTPEFDEALLDPPNR